MVCGGNQSKDGEEEGGGGEGGPFSITYCWSKGKEHADFRRNGKIIDLTTLVSSSGKRGGSPNNFDLFGAFL